MYVFISLFLNVCIYLFVFMYMYIHYAARISRVLVYRVIQDIYHQQQKPLSASPRTPDIFTVTAESGIATLGFEVEALAPGSPTPGPTSAFVDGCCEVPALQKYVQEWPLGIFSKVLGHLFGTFGSR